ncbi:hypothetical protein CI109_102946 [Kwoniella shandongensis]|uniref:Uncharacterized protein n=1 Tax=Kwoniella shandongensis TaxID=1734106 RepID=A0A5M6C882_9TREE|nr:uncharacterized protein CI109_000134 [Kwoniella shandongensis]KAA5531294.1 hypothetical protein CI109_000134 [Kwoniella shandongensis]
MTKLSNSISYRLLRQWDSFCRLLPPSLLFGTPRYEIWSDASGRGYGGHLGPQSRPLDVWQATHSGLGSPGSKYENGSTEYVEAMAVLLSLRRWSDQLRGKKVFCYIDNYTVYKYLSRRYPHPVTTNFPIPIPITIPNNLFFSTMTKKERRTIVPRAKYRGTRETLEQIERLVEEHDIVLRARWVWGKDNRLADRLSRLGRGYSGLPPEVRELLKASAGGSEGSDRPPTTMA